MGGRGRPDPFAIGDRLPNLPERHENSKRGDAAREYAKMESD
jgi:hypothetical protein